MNIVATTTVIRGNGACEAFMNGIVNEEIEKMNERHQKELCAMESELGAVKTHRNKLLASNLAAVRACNARSVSWFVRLKEDITISWCKLYGLGEALKLWLYEK